MTVSNQQYLYDHLPARYRREDKGLLLKRFLQFSGETMDDWDAAYEAFYQSIASGTATDKWVTFWLDALFGWSWFPKWFRLADKRRLYGNFARHLARRGTRRGIELWLLDFGIVARVITRVPPWGEFVYGERNFAVTRPLYIVVEILSIAPPANDQHFYGEGAYGEAYYTDPRPAYTNDEILRLVRFMQPHSQEINIVWRLNDVWKSDAIYWGQISW